MWKRFNGMVWFDKYSISVDDSITESVQTGIEKRIKGCEYMDNIQNEIFYNKVIELFQNAKKNLDGVIRTIIWS